MARLASENFCLVSKRNDLKIYIRFDSQGLLVEGSVLASNEINLEIIFFRGWIC